MPSAHLHAVEQLADTMRMILAKLADGKSTMRDFQIGSVHAQAQIEHALSVLLYLDLIRSKRSLDGKRMIFKLSDDGDLEQSRA